MNVIPMTWEEFNTRTFEMVGKDIESEKNTTRRGPIKTILLDFSKKTVAITFEWVARFDSRSSPDGNWVLAVPPGLTFGIFMKQSDCRVEDIGEGRIRLVEGSGAYHVIFTAHKNLNPTDVKNFPHKL